VSFLVLMTGAAGLLFLLAVLSRRPARIGAAGGLLFGPLFYYWLGGLLARAHGEGRFYSFPLGGYHLGDTEILASVGCWTCAFGVAAYVCARLARRAFSTGRRTRSA